MKLREMKKVIAIAVCAIMIPGGVMAVQVQAADQTMEQSEADQLLESDSAEATEAEEESGNLAELTMVYGGYTLDIELPDGYRWQDATIYSREELFPSSAGEFTMRILDYSGDSLAFAYVTVSVLPKDMSSILLDGIDENTDLDTYEIVAEDMYTKRDVSSEGSLVPTAEDIVLVKDRDYTISSVTEGNITTVTVNFMGNYTGTAQTQYYLTDDTQDTPENQGQDEQDGSDTASDSQGTDTAVTDQTAEETADPDDGSSQTAESDDSSTTTSSVDSVKTGDSSNVALWITVLAAGGAAAVAGASRKRKRY